MNITEFCDMAQAALNEVRCGDYRLKIVETATYAYLQAEYDEADIETKRPATQKTRKWLLSPHMVKSEIIQTALKCVLTSAEHRVRENFTYKGQRIFGPHFDVDVMAAMAEDETAIEVRENPNT